MSYSKWQCHGPVNCWRGDNGCGERCFGCNKFYCNHHEDFIIFIDGDVFCMPCLNKQINNKKIKISRIVDEIMPQILKIKQDDEKDNEKKKQEIRNIIQEEVVKICDEFDHQTSWWELYSNGTVLNDYDTVKRKPFDKDTGLIFENQKDYDRYVNNDTYATMGKADAKRIRKYISILME